MIWLPRHQKTLDQLLSLLTRDKMPHAVLLRGPEGVGKEWLARRFCWSALLRFKRSQDMFGGGESAPIQWEREHPDLVWIKAEEKEDWIKVEQVRELNKMLAFAPLDSEKRFVVICKAEQLNAQAANTILKVLEEPPAHTYFILTARDRSLVLPTIASRCQDLRFAPLSEEEMKAASGESVIPKASEGSLSRLEHLRALEEKKLWAEPAQLLLRCWSKGAPLPALYALFDQVSVANDAQAILESWQALARDLCLVNQGVPLYHASLAAEIRVWSAQSGRSSESLASVASVCDQARVQLRAHVNPRLVLESTVAQILMIA